MMAEQVRERIDAETAEQLQHESVVDDLDAAKFDSPRGESVTEPAARGSLAMLKAVENSYIRTTKSIIQGMDDAEFMHLMGHTGAMAATGAVAATGAAPAAQPRPAPAAAPTSVPKVPAALPATGGRTFETRHVGYAQSMVSEVENKRSSESYMTWKSI